MPQFSSEHCSIKLPPLIFMCRFYEVHVCVRDCANIYESMDKEVLPERLYVCDLSISFLAHFLSVYTENSLA